MRGHLLNCIFVFALLLAAAGTSTGQDLQAQTNYVNDYARVLTAADSRSITSLLHNVERRTKVEVTVVTINSINDYSTGQTIESFATDLFNRWGIGNMPRNDGVLILVAIKDRRCRIELGRGYDGAYDARMKHIIDDIMVPQFRQGNYSTGIRAGTEAVVREVAGPMAWIRAHRLQIVLVILIGVCMAAGISCMRSGKTGWGWAFFAAAAALFVWLLQSIFKGGDGDVDCSDSFGGGDSDGGGASGSW